MMKIEHVLDLCWELFVEYCQRSIRYKKMFANCKPDTEQIDLQRDCFRNGSIAHKTISQWRRNAELFIIHHMLLKRNPFEFDVWLVFSYVRKCKQACKTSGTTAFAALRWINRCFETENWCNEPLVNSQIKRGAIKEVVASCVKEGKMPTVEMVFGMEECVLSGETLMIRVYAGLFCLAIMCSCRGSDCQRTQHLLITKDSFTGQSRMKNHRKWVRWAIPLVGLSGIDWISPWLRDLEKVGMPGVDFITLGVAKSGSAWSKSPAEYADLEFMYHIILMFELHMNADDAASYSIHGREHFLITAATQLEIERDVIYQLGHWHAGSKMLDKYNQTKCVQELKYRWLIQQQFLRGWRLVGGSEIVVPWMQKGIDFNHKCLHSVDARDKARPTNFEQAGAAIARTCAMKRTNVFSDAHHLEKNQKINIEVDVNCSGTPLQEDIPPEHLSI